MIKIDNIIKFYLIDPNEFRDSIIERLKNIYGIYYVSGLNGFKVSIKMENGDSIYEILLHLKNDSDSLYVSIGNINIFNDCIHLNIDSFFIKRHLFNTVNLNMKEDKINNSQYNINYILNLNDKIIGEFDKIALLTKNHICYFESFRLTSTFNFIINLENNEINLNYKLKLEEGLYGNKFFYVSLIDNKLFKKILNNFLSEKYTLNKFGKKLDKLNKKEKELLDVLLY